VVPNSQRLNRGGTVLSELVESCRAADFTDIVVLHEHRGEPGGQQGLASHTVCVCADVWPCCHQHTARMREPRQCCQDE
jgi:hypothetical protein